MFRHFHRLSLQQRTAARRGRATGAALLVALGISASPQLGHAQNTLNVASWGGAYGQSQEIAFFEPFAKETGISIATVIYDGKLANLREMIKDNGGTIDVVDVSAGALDRLCKEGLLDPIDAASLEAPDSGTVQDDFLPGALSPCGVASVAWSMAVAYDHKAFPNGTPTKISALLDRVRFPGKRALPRNARYSLELALLADGVPPESVYRELGTPEGLDRAFAALDKITDDVVLWGKPERPVTWLVEDKVVMAAGYSGRLFRAAVGDRNIRILWDGQVYDFDAWAIPTSSDNKKDALRFIRFATAPARLAEQAELLAYGPMRKSALPLVGNHPVINVDMQAFVPTAPQNFENALKFDDEWWRANDKTINTRFAAWQAKVKAAQAARRAKDAAKQERPAPAP